MMRDLRWLALAGLLAPGCLQKAAVAPVVPAAVVVLPAPKEPAPAPPLTEDGFAFHDDRGGQLLSQLLPPVDRHKVMSPSAGPRTFPPLTALEQPDLSPLPVTTGVVALPPGPPRPLLRPKSPAEEAPLTATRRSPLLPETQPLPAGPLVRSAAPTDGVPVLGAAVPDRASLDDPTKESLLDLVLSGAMPSRSNPAPFVKPAAADPFANRETIKVRTVPPEDTVPASGPPRTPR
jgi:hypothetical protein